VRVGNKTYNFEVIAAMNVKTHLRDFTIGSSGSIVGYDRIYGGYAGKLAAMGLTPGTHFLVLNILPQGTVELLVRGGYIFLSRPEVDALCVETLN
jgi:ferrous iron transport protein A